jgi:hypothetical protein
MMSPVNESTTSQVFAPVLTRLRAEATAFYNAPRAELVPVGYEERPYSHLLRVRVSRGAADGADPHLYVKIFKPKPHDGGVEKMRRRVAEDFQTTRKIYEAMSQWAELGAVRPVACYVDDLAIVTEEARGVTLMRYLLERAPWFPSASVRSELSHTLSAVGRWLRAFQTIDVDDSRVTTSELIEYVDSRLRRLVMRNVFSDADRERLLQHLDGLGTRVSPDDLRAVIVHADMGPGNILVAPGGVVVLDFAMTNRGSYLHDVSRLYLHLRLLGGKPHFRSSVIREVQEALLHGFEPTLTPAHPLFRLVLMLHTVNHFGTLSTRQEPFPANVFSGHIRRQHRRWIEQELRAGSAYEAGV